MDDEDLADAEESRKIQTSTAFAGFGATDHPVRVAGGLAGLFQVQGETKGTKLLKKMGWREGQGIGPKVRRKANLDLASRPGSDDTYLFAPDNAPTIGFVRKTDRKGLGYDRGQRLAPLAPSRSRHQSDDEDEDDGSGGGLGLRRPKSLASSTFNKKDNGGKARGGIGMGVLNDTGSDDEDPYEIGPRISYSRVVGGSKIKKKKKDAVTTVNPVLKSKPVFMPKRASLGLSTLDTRTCHDGRPPLEGFVLGQRPDPLISMVDADGKYPPPEIPQGWKPSKQAETSAKPSQYVSTADAAKASQLNPTARAALLGEKQLPGKSVFDFLSSAARDRLAAASGKGDLPQAKGEIPDGYALSEKEKRRGILERIPKLDKQSALAAMTRGASSGGPYGDNEDKRARYRGYLEVQAGLRHEPPDRPARMTTDEWMQEFNEFYNVARIFRPMTGSMASRFTTSSSSSCPTSNMVTGSDGKIDETGLVSKPMVKPEDPAETAAKMGMYGHMTRLIRDFHPTRLLCKRFNVKPPAHVQGGDGDLNINAAHRSESGPGPMPMPMLTDGMRRVDPNVSSTNDVPGTGESSANVQKQEDVYVVDRGRNDALEGKRAGEEVFRAIFGDSSDEES